MASAPGTTRWALSSAKLGRPKEAPRGPQANGGARRGPKAHSPPTASCPACAPAPRRRAGGPSPRTSGTPRRPRARAPRPSRGIEESRTRGALLTLAALRQTQIGDPCEEGRGRERRARMRGIGKGRRGEERAPRRGRGGGREGRRGKCGREGEGGRREDEEGGRGRTREGMRNTMRYGGESHPAILDPHPRLIPNVSSCQLEKLERPNVNMAQEDQNHH